MEAILAITLPPGPIEPAMLVRLLEITTGPQGWIRPTSYGSGGPHETGLQDREDPVAAIASCMAKSGCVSFEDETGLACVNVLPDRDRLSYTGMVYAAGDWVHFVSRLVRDTDAVAEVMALLRSPFAFAAASGSLATFANRRDLSAEGHSRRSRAEIAAGSYRTGIERPHWRMWFGVEWTDFLGRDVLQRAPALESHQQGAGWFVQVHDQPEKWNHPAGLEAAAQFAAALSRPVFHHPADPERAIETPDFSRLMRTAKMRYPHLEEQALEAPEESP